MRFLLFSMGLLFAGLVQGQGVNVSPVPVSEGDSVEIELKVGDTMEIGPCPSDHFEHLDYFRKTRWVGGEPAYDTATGQGFYHSFFTTGDFNVYELPASFSGQKFAIMGMEVLVNKNTGNDMGVLYLVGPDPNSVIWVDFEEAMASGELGLPAMPDKKP